MNKIRDAFTLIRARIRKQYFPYYVNLILNNTCNLRCGYCYKKFYSRKCREMETAEVLRLIDELHQLGTRRICILGGEPLLRKDLAAVVEKIKGKGIVCGINTNGILAASHLDLIKKLDYVHISLDGDRTSNDLNRGEGTYDKVIQALECISKNTKTPLGISCTLTKNNLASIEYLTQIAKRYGAVVSFFILMSQEDEKGMMQYSALVPSWQEYVNAIDKILLLKKQGAPIRGSRAIYELTKKWPLGCQDVVMAKPVNFKWIDCFAAKFFCTIDVDGKVYPCPRLVGEIEGLNALEIGLQRALEHCRTSNPCKACNILCYNELNFVFGFNPSVISNYVRKF